jgi:hypothetical protein
MIDRFACLPRRITRRGFGMGLGAALGAEYLARRKERTVYAAGSPFTIAMVPDPQNLAGDSPCSGAAAYNGLIQWGITNRNLSVNGIPLNIKGFLSVGDCANTVSATVYDAQQQISVNAYALAEAASPRMFVVRAVGNHDYQGNNGNRANIAYMFRDDRPGAWSSTNVAATYSGGMDLGSGDSAVFGGVYPDPTFPVGTANNYVRVSIQGMKIGMMSMELFPRTGVVTWALGIIRSYPDHQWWITTHGYMDTLGALATRGSTYGPAAYTLGNPPLSNSGDELQALVLAEPNLTGIFCGHWIDGYAGGSNWVWQKMATTSTSTRGQTVQQLMCNCQGGVLTDGDLQTFGTSTVLDGTTDVMHLMLLRIDPATQLMESFLVSTNNGKYTGGLGVLNSASPIQLFNVSMQQPPSAGVSSHVLIG